VQGDTISFDINYLLEEIPPAPPGGDSGGDGGSGGGFGGGGEFGGGPSSTPTATPKISPSRFVEIDLLGEKTRREISDDNKFLESYTGKTSDGSLTVSFSKGTSISSDPEKDPSRIVFDVDPLTVSAGENEYIIGSIYRIQVCDNNDDNISATFSPPFLISHAYNTQDLPPDTKSIYLDYYDETSQRWSPLELPRPISKTRAIVGDGRPVMVDS
jgi:hypothetical protein